MSAGVCKAVISWSVNRPPNTAMTTPAISVSASADPAIARTRSWSPAPNAWPTSTVVPMPRPMTKAMKKNSTGKNTVAAASASTPSMWPRKMLLSVPDNDWSTLLNIIGTRKAMKVFHSGAGAFGDVFGDPRSILGGGAATASMGQSLFFFVFWEDSTA